MQARSVEVCGDASLAAPGRWADFGRRTLTLALILPDSEATFPASQPVSQGSQGGAGSPPPGAGQPDLLEIAYEGLEGAAVAVQGGEATLTLALRALPDALLDAGLGGQGAEGRPQVRLVLPAAELAAVAAEAPAVAAALRRAGVALPPAAADVTQPDKARKVSMCESG
jgi:hypothetical protein